jgi:hypothetical protein
MPIAMPCPPAVFDHRRINSEFIVHDLDVVSAAQLIPCRRQRVFRCRS